MADEEVTDLTEEEDSGGGKKEKVKLTKEEKKAAKEEAKRAKQEAKEAKKAEKEAKKAEKGKEPTEEDGEKPEEKPEEKSEEKPLKAKKIKSGDGEGSGMGVVVVMLIAVLVLVGGIVAALYFDVFSARAITADFVRDPLVRFISWLDPSFSAVTEELREIAQARENAITVREELLYQREEEVAKREALALATEEQLERREKELDRWEEEVRTAYERITPLYRRDMTDEELEDMISYATTFTRMSPADAAEILVRIYNTPEDVAGLLYYMSERNRAPILAALHPEFAAAVTDVWLYN